ncbi:polysaccharide biosynthesis protein [Candidatus Woesearchaeota archaeon]|nr:polysaccharide biosynthesis protein [Candidatus Woesearchaeota archaeon]
MKGVFEGKDILVTGGCGSIGSEIVKQLLKYNPEKIRVFDNNESNLFHLGQELATDRIRLLIGDIRDRNRVQRAVKGAHIIFHAAALKHVSLCEYNPFEAVSTNIVGTENLISASIDNNVEKFIGISTDKAVNPINTMGATKLLSEKVIIDTAISNADTKFCCVRFGNVLDSVGSVIPIFRKQIENGGPLTITDKEMSRYFMTKSDAISLVLKAAEVTRSGEIFVLKMSALKVIDLAHAMIEELAPKHGHEPKDIKLRFIGARFGEKMHESLMTQEESVYSEDMGNMYVIRHPSVSDMAKKRKADMDSNSKNASYLNISQIKDILRKARIV